MSPKLPGYLEFSAKPVSTLPIPLWESRGKSGTALFDNIVAQTRELNSLMDGTKPRSAHGKQLQQREITALDHQIDQLVYEFYGLTAQEIALVEAATVPREEPAEEAAPAERIKRGRKKSKFWDDA
jgi:hypothetical protein